jgi:hypothetical protein
MEKQGDWNPVKKGGVYCSPACGRGCTNKEYRQAWSDANKLLKKMKSKGWEVRVWENLGWHYELVSRHISLHVLKGVKGPSYGTMMNLTEEFSCAGQPELRSPGYYSDPNDAVANQLKVAEDYMNKLQLAINLVKQLKAGIK